MPTSHDSAPASIDTSKMSAGQRAALEMTEAARDHGDSQRNFCGGLFMGRADFSALHPFPQPEPEEKARGDAFLSKLENFLRTQVNPDEIDASGEIPQSVFDGLADLKAFAIKIPTEYGGLGLSQTNYCRAGMLLGSYCSNLTALVSAHQSIGVPQPLLMFGTEEQKLRFLPRFAHGEVSAFALTEKGVGSDPAKMETTAIPTADGKHFLINGEKMWCTNGLKAGVIVVMAKTPPKDGRNQITAGFRDGSDRLRGKVVRTELHPQQPEHATFALNLEVIGMDYARALAVLAAVRGLAQMAGPKLEPVGTLAAPPDAAACAVLV